MQPLQLIATTPMGLEAVVSRELKLLGYEDITVENGRVTFAADFKDIARCNLWLRSADRILVKMGEFKATTFDELFEGTKALPWQEWIPQNGEFPVEGRSHKSQLSSVPASQGIVKKAIVEKLKQTYHTEWFPENGARFVIEVNLHNDIALLTLDTSGAGLHKRGYRKLVTEAPLKETLAAALIQLSRWGPHRPFYDPFCGSGTLLVEAAMIGWNIAPGLRRSFNSEHWPLVSKELWDEAREEAFDSVKDDIPLQIAGSDIDPSAIEVAQAAVKSAGFAKEIKLDVLPVAKVRLPGDYGCLITNPPYGERLGEQAEVEKLIRQLGRVAAEVPTWSFFAITSTKSFERYFNQKADKRRKLFNGRIETQYYQFLGPLPPKPARN
ncbi:class I SAM-dependent RNA methyltransferase [Paenibacillus urinalis]|uniref:Class I SAM-dependent RNA methyltransferase n=1 Tax=Paenibacillus urinalis TaxID=521520 RepID=A0AAX3N423_9BACL|nr:MULTISPECIES: class I SAM-dependent RNA methyltransferase [Paenibacillus]WDH84317.1 class I SAM-dependent RNA methyltransferase [Paenibacillus urinalis]WDH95786.1 class I SAM-dependent RNA methyltransferase [Paenibacillus urinalis]WDI04000.1 class I SAM-dependent RNA methyltransferase [Paenibacillus urinalis]GAK38691.1 methyltransferase [Paenibacillus sp. TCA20]